MASSPPAALLLSLSFFFFLHFPVRLSADEAADVAECGPQLLQLAPCMPFVQGSTSSPERMCCDNLVSLYSRLPKCLCMLLTESSTFPINQTLALSLPLLCDLHADSSECPGLTNLSPSTPESASNRGASINTSSTPFTSAGAPRTTVLNSGGKIKAKEAWVYAIVAFSLAKILS